MTVVDAKDLKFGPLVSRNARGFLRRLDHIENDRYSIFICLSNDSNVCIGGKGLDHSEGLRADLTRLEEGQSALRLILLQQLCHCSLDTFRGHLGLGSRPRYVVLGLLGEHRRPHYHSERGPLSHILHEARRRVRRLQLVGLGGLRARPEPLG